MHCALRIDHDASTIDTFFLTCPIFLKTQDCDINFELILKQTQNAIEHIRMLVLIVHKFNCLVRVYPI